LVPGSGCLFLGMNPARRGAVPDHLSPERSGNVVARASVGQEMIRWIGSPSQQSIFVMWISIVEP